jgi:hypothetical protein
MTVDFDLTGYQIHAGIIDNAQRQRGDSLTLGAGIERIGNVLNINFSGGHTNLPAGGYSLVIKLIPPVGKLVEIPEPFQIVNSLIQ